MAKVTINDLARITGYSKSTISYALNGKEGVGEEARAEIIRIAKDLGYTPNYFAKRISHKNYRTIGVILRDLTNPFYANVFCAIDKLAEENNYETIFYNLAGDSQRTRSGIELMKEKMVSGIIIDFFGHDEEITKSLFDSGIPAVVFGLNVDAELSCVQTDDVRGVKEAVDYGVQLGYKDIFYVGRDGNHNDVFDVQRGKTVIDQLRFHKLAWSDHIIRLPDDADSAEYVIQKCPKNSLLICYNDVLACSVIRGLMKHKLYVPEDYSVIGFDNISIVPYSLTTVDIPQYEMACTAFKLLFEQIEHGAPKEKITLDAKLIIRDSVKDLRQ